MNPSAESKLHELRSKTNRQLASLISHKLDRGLAFARVLEGDPNWAAADRFRVFAERELAQARAWIPLLDGATQLELRRMEFKLTQLQGLLEQTAPPKLRAQAAC